MFIDFAATKKATSATLKALEVETEDIGRLENGKLLDGAALLVAVGAVVHVVPVQDLGVREVFEGGAHRGAFNLEGNVEDRVVRVGLVAAFSALDLRPEVPAPNLVHHRSLLDAHVLELRGFGKFLERVVLETLHHEAEEFLGVLLSAWS